MLRELLLLKCCCFLTSFSAFVPWNVTAVFKGFATWQARPYEQTADFQDKLMDATCNQQFPGSKAAYQQQVLAQLISKLPPLNTAGYAVQLKCRQCQFNPSDQSCLRNRNNVSLDCFGRTQPTTLDGVARRCVLAVDDGQVVTSLADVAPSRKWPIQYYNLFDNCFSNTTRAAMCVITDTVNILPIVSGPCTGNCGKKVGYCFCDNICLNNGDCCPGFSFQLQCDVTPPSIPTVVTSLACENKCGEKVGFCYCDSECAITGDCCVGFSFPLQCAGVTPLNFTTVIFPLAPKSTAPWENRVLPTSVCVDHCNDKVGYCHCDSQCETSGDCCPFFSYELTCTQQPLANLVPLDANFILDTCENKCAGFTGQCWCDAECRNSDDCCVDIERFCGSV